MASKLKKVNMVYRTIIQMPLIDVITENHFWEEFGIKLNLGYTTRTQDADNQLLSGEVDIVVGNHTAPYVLKATRGAKLVYFAQTINKTSHVFVTRPEIKSLADLKGKRIAEVAPGSHPEIQLRIYLENIGINLERDKVTLVFLDGDTDPRRKLRMVLEKEVDAAMVWPPFDIKGKKAGLNIIPIPKRPMIRGVTYYSTSDWVNKNEDLVMGMLKALIKGIHFFKTKKEETKKILARNSAKTMGITDKDDLDYLYDYCNDDLPRKPYPECLAIQNVFDLVLKDYPELATLNPLSLWDMHYVRMLDESGFIDDLYKK